jgi:hypothetical protein
MTHKFKSPAMKEASQGRLLSDGSGSVNRGDNRQIQRTNERTNAANADNAANASIANPAPLVKKTIPGERLYGNGATNRGSTKS